MRNLRVSVTRSSDADPPQSWQAAADENGVAGELEVTRTGRDLAERVLIVAVVVLLGTVTGVSIWAQHTTSGLANSARSEVVALQAIDSSTDDFAAAKTVPALQRAVARTGPRLAGLAPDAGVRAARAALADERRSLALSSGKAISRAQARGAVRIESALAGVGADQRTAIAASLASLHAKQERAWRLTLAAFPAGLLIVGALIALLRIMRARARAGADAKLAHLEKVATTDPLTGLRNRRTFDDDLARSLARGRVCLVMLDLDGLKQTNERLGHAVGDERIRAVSAALRSADSSALGYRLGGDEFAAILADAGADAGHRFAHRVQDAMRVQHGGDGPSVAVGVAVGELRTPTSDLMRRADTALLAAKRMHLSDPRPLARARHRDAQARGWAQAGRPHRRAGRRSRRQGRRRLRPQPHGGRSGVLHGRAGRALDRAGRARARWRACCTTSAISTSTTRSSPRASRRPTPSGTSSRRTPSAALASSAAAGSARSRSGSATITSAWTGRGIPAASRARTIPIESRILHVADAYEAMTRGHSYQTRMTSDAALAELERLAGSQFDPQCVAALRRTTARAQAA